jgi:hypothetical protein
MDTPLRLVDFICCFVLLILPAYGESARKGHLMPRTTSKVIMNFLGLVIAGYFLFTSASEIFAQEFIGYSAAGIDTNSIKPVVDAFCNVIGPPNNGNAPGPLTSGRREINWDGGGNNSTTSPAPTPFTGFQLIRGALFTTPGTGLAQAPPSGLATTFNNAT